jgi:signal transduction histidine kinase
MSSAPGVTRPPPPAQILLVDDIAANRLALRAVLEPLGQQIIEARSGDEALKATLDHDFAVILMDVQMPGMDGFETVQILRQRERTRVTPVIFVTAFGDITPATRGYSLGAFDFMTKPLDPDVLRARVGALVALWQRGQQLEQQAEELRQNEVARACERAAREAAEAANRMKDEFLATLSHELRTPLSAILGWAQVLRRGGKDENDLQRGLQTIERNARAQAQLIEDLLDMSRITSGKVLLDMQTLNPQGFLDAAIETVRPAADAKNIRIEKRFAVHPGMLVAGDPARLQQVVWNLLSNAIKFTPRDGLVTVDLEGRDGSVVVTVRDSGAGIRPEFITHVFERFRQADASMTRRHGGLGLGLAIVKHLIEQHGGTVRAESPGEGLGSSFSFELPLAKAQTRAERRASMILGGTPPPAAPDLTLRDLNGASVLVVDDDRDARELIARILTDCHAKVRIAASAREAFSALQLEMPDLLISDLGMPEVDGFELLSWVRALPRDRGGLLPAVALTAFARSEDRLRALEAGFSSHISKPVEPSELIDVVGSLVRSTGNRKR